MKISDRIHGETGRDYALRTLKDNIINLELPPGSMVSENELAAELKVSRSPVREALIELSKVNIVEIFPQKGSAISLIDPVMVEEVFFMRETLECEIVRRVCSMADQKDLTMLQAMVSDQKHYVQTGGFGRQESFMTLDNRFHQQLFEIARKPFVFRVIQDFVIHFDRIRKLTIDYSTSAQVASQHEQIVEAIVSRDSRTAVRMLRQHLEHFRNILDSLQKEYPDYFVKGDVQ